MEVVMWMLAEVAANAPMGWPEAFAYAAASAAAAAVFWAMFKYM